jgi:hypothetical protein
MFRRRPLLPAVVMPLIIGVAGFVRLMDQPRFAAYRTVDVVQRTGSGMCFGIAPAALIVFFRLPRE